MTMMQTPSDPLFRNREEAQGHRLQELHEQLKRQAPAAGAQFGDIFSDIFGPNLKKGK